MARAVSRAKTSPAVRGDGNAKSIALIQEMIGWGKADLSQPKEVAERIDRFFKLMARHNSKPLVAGLAQSLGLTRNQLYCIVNNITMNTKDYHVAEESRELIKEAYSLLEVAFEYVFTNGNINPVAGIFLAKNHFGYRDQQEVVVAPKNILGQTEDQAKLEERLLASIVTDK